MIDLFLSLVALILFLVSIILGALIYNNKDKRKFNFLNMFPFEMKSKDYRLNNLFYLILTLSLGFVIYVSLYLFYLYEVVLLSKFLSLSLIFCSLLLISLFVIDFKNYKLHLLTSILFTTLNAMNYAVFSYLGYRFAFTKYPLWSSIIGVVVTIFLLILLLLPSLKSWYLLKKNQNNEFVRGRIHPYAFIEWINIILYILLFAFASIAKLLI